MLSLKCFYGHEVCFFWDLPSQLIQQLHTFNHSISRCAYDLGRRGVAVDVNYAFLNRFWFLANLHRSVAIIHPSFSFTFASRSGCIINNRNTMSLINTKPTGVLKRMLYHLFILKSCKQPVFAILFCINNSQAILLLLKFQL